MQEQLEGAPLIKPSSTDHPLYDTIVEACRTVYDPEIPVNIYDLGLVYTIEISAENEVEVTMTLTAPGCPVAGEMPGWLADAIGPIDGVKTINVEITWDPPWGMEMMSDEARLELGFMWDQVFWLDFPNIKSYGLMYISHTIVLQSDIL